MTRGKFVVISGPDGAGKTTLIKKIRELYGDALVYVREPGGTDLSEKIRKEVLSSVGAGWSPVTQLLHFFCARANLLSLVVEKALSSGIGVIADRFDESTFAYQVVAPQNRELEPLFWSIRKSLLVDQGLAPDLYILVQVPVEVGVERRARDKSQETTHFDEREHSFHRMVAEGLSEFFSRVPHSVVDGSQPREKVLIDCLRILEPFFGKPNTGPGT